MVGTMLHRHRRIRVTFSRGRAVKFDIVLLHFVGAMGLTTFVRGIYF